MRAIPARDPLYLGQEPGGRPSFSLDFARLEDPVTKYGFTFTRATSATYVNASGQIATAASGALRYTYDPVTLASLGVLIEEQRTNLLLNSATLSTQSVTVLAVPYTLSFYGSGTVTLSGASSAGPLVGTGAYPNRVTLTFTPTAGSLTLTVSGSVTNAQLEAVSFASSWIPTTGTSATRNADVLTLTGAADVIAPWFNKDAGSILVSGITNCGTAATLTARAFMFSDGTTSNRLGINKTAGVLQAANVVASGGSMQANITDAGNWSQTIGKKCAMAYALNDVAMYVAGVAGTADVVASMPTGLTTLGIGVNHASLELWNGTISRLAYYPRRLPNATLQRLTA